MKDKESTIILIAVIVLFGLAFEPLKNASKKESDDKNHNQSSISSNNENYNTEDVSQTIRDSKYEIEKLERDIAEKTEKSKRSEYYGKIDISYISGLNNSDPGMEYIYLYTNLQKNEKVNITGWYLKSEITGNYVFIGKTSLLPFPFTKGEDDILLKNGDRAILTKGFSPIGISFRANMCTGYFEEKTRFYPSLSRQCPLPKEEKLPTFSSNHERNDECLDLIENIPRCTTIGNEYIRKLPDTVTNSCKTYMKNQINYNSCVANHFGDIDFPGNEYRVYFNIFGKLWKDKREKIHLYDKSGLIVDTISY